MSKTLSSVILIAYITLWLVFSINSPWILGDANSFLKEFINHEFISFMGMLVTITLASAANIHIELNKIEAKAGEKFLSATRFAVKRSAFWLIWSLFFSVLLVIIKPLVCVSDIASSLVNGSAIFLILGSILIIADLTKLAFSIQQPD